MSEKETVAQATEIITNTKKKAAGNTDVNKEVPDPENVIYIGPNSLADGLKKYTVYRGRPSELIEAVRAKYKNIYRLFVTIDNLNDAMATAERAGTPINLAYNEVMEANR